MCEQNNPHDRRIITLSPLFRLGFRAACSSLDTSIHNLQLFKYASRYNKHSIHTYEDLYISYLYSNLSLHWNEKPTASSWSRDSCARVVQHSFSIEQCNLDECFLSNIMRFNISFDHRHNHIRHTPLFIKRASNYSLTLLASIGFRSGYISQATTNVSSLITPKTITRAHVSQVLYIACKIDQSILPKTLSCKSNI